jgi:hypothetical protein
MNQILDFTGSGLYQCSQVNNFKTNIFHNLYGNARMFYFFNIHFFFFLILILFYFFFFNIFIFFFFDFILFFKK